MLKNYFKIAIRNLIRKKLYGTINIMGLALGLASAFVIGTWVWQEISYERHFDNADRIYRVGVNFFNVGDMAVGPPVFKSVVSDFPEVEAVTSIDYESDLLIFAEDREFQEDHAYRADDDFFEVFSYPFIKGDPETALDYPKQVVLTSPMAEKLFGSQEAMGKSIEIGEDKVSYVVAGIVGETNFKTHFNTDIWISMERNPDATSWTSAQIYNYVQLKPGFDKNALDSRLEELIKNQIFPGLNRNQPYEEWIKSSAAYKFIVFPLTDLYLRSNLKFDFFTGGNATNVYAFAAIALFIILLAAINFINISTARSSGRAKEVGIRKTLGSNRKSLVLQFLNESVLTCLLAFFLSLGIAEIFLKMFQQFTSIQLLNSLFIGPGQLLLFLLTTVLIGVTAGLYPAFYLSSFKPVSMLRNQFGGVRKSWFRNGLVITQFTISTCLIVATGAVYKQLSFLQDKDLGFDTDHVLVIENASLLGSRQQSFKQEVQVLSGVKTASYNRRMPVGKSVWVKSFKTVNMEEGKLFQLFFGDEDYMNTMGFHLLKGRNFSKDIAGDTSAVILNQSAVEALELQQPLGTMLNDNQEIIGIVADFNFESLHREVEPAAIMFSDTAERMALKIDGTQAASILARLNNIWEYHSPEKTMDYYFLDEQFQQTLSNERSLGKAITLFAGFAIVISCLGLFGLSSYICEQRTKEIGIRKVLGATVSKLVILLNKDFTKLILVSIAIAVPVSFIIMNRWLSNFAYKTDIGPVIFILAGILALIITWVTVSGQSIKTAFRNPVESLRNE